MRRRGGSVLVVAFAAATSLLASAPEAVEIALPPPPPPIPAPPPTPLAPDELAARTVPVVVTIDASRGWTGTSGTGIVLTPDGTVLTNHHVVSGATDITAVSAATGLIYDVDVIGYDSARDIAVLQLGTANGLPAAPVADALPPAGTPVTAFGNADGGGVVIAAPGTVIAADRSVMVRDSTEGSRKRLTGMLQTDTPIRPGDSGGPLVDHYGAVVGVNTAGAIEREQQEPSESAPEAYAVPIAEALAVVEQVRTGVGTDTVHVGPTPRLGLGVTTARADGADRGAEVLWVSFDTPAYRAGLEAGDVVVSFGGDTVSSTTDLEQRLRTRKPGDTVRIEWLDGDGRSRTADVVLEDGPAR
ncbi:trypsin-like peptidase domain-containing protein [Rhodococcus sp. (in: high G+C Gram-positive bacteria)]|uniref:S1C family serine protease n=1 Tax=Rhodococcus sp. TaxID=1831 RepID=UPI0019F24052|nr:trypsin-like peptidase domain-containing protein [Rhodococcus sp. (in: high G+C Gram-positive bacteria)]MBF0660553.1 trypsin-like peptidase domain-containing protein [Rhodococcus sp. (in: high G+C Gram-positive bacteria)]